MTTSFMNQYDYYYAIVVITSQVVLFYMHTNNNRTHCCSAYLSSCDRTASDANLLAIRTLFIALTTS